ncbi:MAG: ABC transporter substrate-binding protein [archaeon YNP-WB-062]|jgi:peptide/nickel transport system substrate-binding protein|nr:ABC transporter substrate-binding protein [Candidatus Culexarchaeum yellowstonense]
MKKLLIGVLIVSLVLSVFVGFNSVSFAQKRYKEAPMLAELVKSGKLPPVEQRLPKEPLVLTLRRNAAPDGVLKTLKIGKYGGTLRLIHAAPGFGPEMYFLTIEPLLSRPGYNIADPITGNVLKGYKISPDKKTFTFFLREGLKWSDGVPVTTDDVKFNYEDIILNSDLTPSIPYYYRAEMKSDGAVCKLEVLDQYTFRITFAKPTPGFLDEISKPWMDYTLFIQPKHFLKQFHPKYADKDELAKKLASAKLLTKEWARLFKQYSLLPWASKTPENIQCPTLHPWIVTNLTPTTVTFERNPYYFKVDAVGNQLPYIDKVVSTKVESTDAAVLKIISGEVDLADELARMTSYPLFKQYEAKGGYKVIPMELPYNPTVLAFNFTYDDPVWQKIVNDLRFRQALNYAIDRNHIIDAVYYGLAELPEWVPAEYNVAKANALLDEMGLDKKDTQGWRLGPDGKRFELRIVVTPHLPDTIPANEIVAENFKAIGLYTTLDTIDVSLYFQRRSGNQLQVDTSWNEATTLYALGHAPSHLTAPSPLFGQWYSSDGKKGKEPPQWFKELYNLASQIGPGHRWNEKIFQEFKQKFRDTIPIINYVEKQKKGIIVNAKLDNVFTTGVGQWLLYSAEQLFYK